MISNFSTVYVLCLLSSLGYLAVVKGLAFTGALLGFAVDPALFQIVAVAAGPFFVAYPPFRKRILSFLSS